MNSEIEFFSHSGVYTLKARQVLSMTVSEAWAFLSDPSNLSRITPPEMNFEITNGRPEKAYAGQIITYKVSPLKGIRSNWVTEITVVKEGEFFIDEQRFGPYKMWHHEHRIREVEGGVEMIDKITYKLPGGIIGRLFHPILVKPQLLRIFQFREQALLKFDQKK